LNKDKVIKHFIEHILECADDAICECNSPDGVNHQNIRVNLKDIQYFGRMIIEILD